MRGAELDALESVILLLDLNCFYCQVEELKDLSLAGQPVCVCQKQYIVTSNYLAREKGVRKGCSLEEAKAICPQVIIKNGEDLTDYRKASDAFISVLQDILDGTNAVLQVVGLDEVYIDVTCLVALCLNYMMDSTGTSASVLSEQDSVVSRFFSQEHFVKIQTTQTIQSTGWRCTLNEASGELCLTNAPHDYKILGKQDVNLESYEITQDVRGPRPVGFKPTTSVVHSQKNTLKSGFDVNLTIACYICEKLRYFVYERLMLSTSAGVASSKVLAKLACVYKREPRCQLAIYPSAAEPFLKMHHLSAIPRVGRVSYDIFSLHGIEAVQDVLKYSMEEFIRLFPNNKSLAEYVSLACRGLDTLVDPVVASDRVPKSLSVEDSFSCQGGLTLYSHVLNVLKNLVSRLLKRQQEHLKLHREIPSTLKLTLRFHQEYNRVSRQKAISANLRNLFSTCKDIQCLFECFYHEAQELLISWIPADRHLKKPIYVVNLCVLNFRQLPPQTKTLFDYAVKEASQARSSSTWRKVRRLNRRLRAKRYQKCSVFRFSVYKLQQEND